MIKNWRQIRNILTKKVAALTLFYLFLAVSLIIAAVLVVRTSRTGISDYNNLTERYIRISNILMNIQQEANDIQSSTMRVILNNETEDVNGELDYMQQIDQKNRNNWNNCRDWMEETGQLQLYDSLSYYHNTYNNITVKLLNRSAADNEAAIRFYYSDQMSAFNAYQQHIQFASTVISSNIETHMYATNAKVAAGSNNANFWLAVSFLIMVAGSILIARHNRKLLGVQHELAIEKQRKLNEITQQTLNAQERERNEIGRELHDNVNQLLTVAKLNLSMIVERPEKASELAPRSVKYVEDAIQEIRMLCKTLVSPMKNDIALQDSLRDLVATVQSVNERTFFTFSSNVDRDDHIQYDLKISLYRIVQEQLNNIIKHAEADDVHVSLMYEEQLLKLIIQDNGRGFDIGSISNGVGVSSMSTRAEALHGTISLESSPGEGCTLTGIFPLAPPASKPQRTRSILRKIAANYF